jgi:hypothetical protein
MTSSPPDLTALVGEVLAVIADGEVTGYGEVARAVGLPRGARAVARVLASAGFGWDLAAPVVPVGRMRGRAAHRCFVVPELGVGEDSRSAGLERRAVSFTREGSGEDAVLLIPTAQCLDAAELAERLG